MKLCFVQHRLVIEEKEVAVYESGKWRTPAGDEFLLVRIDSATENIFIQADCADLRPRQHGPFASMRCADGTLYRGDIPGNAIAIFDSKSLTWALLPELTRCRTLLVTDELPAAPKSSGDPSRC
jgi:hypothetical protein